MKCNYFSSRFSYRY